MEKLQNSETELIGSWLETKGTVEEDDVCLRIQFLIENVLQFLKADSNNWCSLYRDPSDERFWELTYPQSELHGGGPESLTNLSSETARQKYKLE